MRTCVLSMVVVGLIAGSLFAAEPAARYQSAADLRADIGRYLADQSVTAYRESPAERVWRILVHYRVAVLLVLMYLAMRIVFAIYQAGKGTSAES